MRHLERQTFIARPIEEVFEFFSNAGNLEKITPSTVGFHILTPQPIDMHAGILIDYEIKLMGVKVKWRTKITAWEPPHLFTDVSLRGPYKQWIHTHRFEAEAGGTRMFDTVDYEVPGGPFEPLVHSLFVGPKLRDIFTHREESIREHFATQSARAAPL